MAQYQTASPREPSRRFDPAAVEQMELLIQDFGRMYRERNDLLKEVTRAHHETLLRLAMAAEFKDDDTGSHIIRIGYLSEALALRLGCRIEFASLLRKAAPMHDIGKVGIPDRILLKPGRYEAEEFAIMQRHPLLGLQAIEHAEQSLGMSVDFLNMAKEIAYGHHEKWDGSGYPQGLAGEAIPLSARLMALADVYDALISRRVYKEGMPHHQAAEIIAQGRGSHFDPDMVDAFFQIEQTFIAIAQRYLDSDRDLQAKAAQN